MVGRHPLMPHSAQRVVRAVGAGLILAFLCAPGTRAQTPPVAPAPQRPRCRRLRRPMHSAATRRGVACLAFSTPHAKGRTRLRRSTSATELGQPASTLAHQLFVVLDARLPARLTQVSDSPEGSRSNPLKPNEEVVGAVPCRRRLSRHRRGASGRTGREANLAVFNGHAERRPHPLQRSDVRPRRGIAAAHPHRQQSRRRTPTRMGHRAARDSARSTSSRCSSTGCCGRRSPDCGEGSSRIRRCSRGTFCRCRSGCCWWRAQRGGC